MNPEEAYNMVMEGIKKHKKYIIKKYSEGMEISNISQALWREHRYAAETFMIATYLQDECGIDIGRSASVIGTRRKKWFAEMEELIPFDAEIIEAYVEHDMTPNKISWQLKCRVSCHENSVKKYVMYMTGIDMRTWEESRRAISPEEEKQMEKMIDRITDGELAEKLNKSKPSIRSARRRIERRKNQ